MDDFTQTLGVAPLLGIAAGAVALVLVLVTAFATGIPPGAIVGVLTDGFGSTLASVALLIGLGAMLGKLVEHSGGARALAERLVERFGEKHAPFALGVASLLVGFPIFAVARRLGGGNVLRYGIPAAAAFSVMHVFVPPHPGPVAATTPYGANLGVVLLVGLVIAFLLWYVSGHLWGLRVGRTTVLPVPVLFGDVDEDQPTSPPATSTVVTMLLPPLVLT